MKPVSLTAGNDPALELALHEIRALYPWRFACSPSTQPEALRLTLHRDERLAGETAMLRLEREPDESFRLVYGRAAEALRGLGILMGRLECGLPVEPFQQETPFASLGVMLDLSRNAVLKVATIKRLIRQVALMGVNRIFLYLEDTYDIRGEPLFGYFRGRYSATELKEIDDDAALFGIEVIPFIQTLGHLRQVLQWPVYAPLQDTAEILLARDDAALELIGKMVQAATEPFRSRRVHLGMDEAHGIGSGQFLLRNGYIPPFEILSRHLEEVAGICRKLGLRPMIWSDMFFRLGSKTNDYYDPDATIPCTVAGRIPPDVELVYWDYYHTEPDFYREWIRRHKELGRPPLFSAGAWTWNRFWALLPRARATLLAGMTAAREAGLKEAFITLWGDDGGECPAHSALPAIQYFADLAYEPEPRSSESNLKGSCHADASAWELAGSLDYHPVHGDPAKAILNTTKWLLWHDPLLNFLEREMAGLTPDHYHKLHKQLKEAARNDERLDFPRRLVEAVALKLELHRALRPAYRDGNLALLADIAERQIPHLAGVIRTLWLHHREQWHRENKPFGWETLERRYGGLLLRLETLRDKLTSHVADPAPIPELEHEPHPVYPAKELPEIVINHRKAATPSMIL